MKMDIRFSRIVTGCCGSYQLYNISARMQASDVA